MKSLQYLRTAVVTACAFISLYITSLNAGYPTLPKGWDWATTPVEKGLNVDRKIVGFYEEEILVNLRPTYSNSDSGWARTPAILNPVTNKYALLLPGLDLKWLDGNTDFPDQADSAIVHQVFSTAAYISSINPHNNQVAGTISLMDSTPSSITYTAGFVSRLPSPNVVDQKIKYNYLPSLDGSTGNNTAVAVRVSEDGKTVFGAEWTGLKANPKELADQTKDYSSSPLLEEELPINDTAQHQSSVQLNYVFWTKQDDGSYNAEAVDFQASAPETGTLLNQGKVAIYPVAASDDLSVIGVNRIYTSGDAYSIAGTIRVKNGTRVFSRLPDTGTSQLISINGKGTQALVIRGSHLMIVNTADINTFFGAINNSDYLPGTVSNYGMDLAPPISTQHYDADPDEVFSGYLVGKNFSALGHPNPRSFFPTGSIVALNGYFINPVPIGSIKHSAFQTAAIKKGVMIVVTPYSQENSDSAPQLLWAGMALPLKLPDSPPLPTVSEDLQQQFYALGLNKPMPPTMVFLQPQELTPTVPVSRRENVINAANTLAKALCCIHSRIKP